MEMSSRDDASLTELKCLVQRSLPGWSSAELDMYFQKLIELDFIEIHASSVHNLQQLASDAALQMQCFRSVRVLLGKL